MIISVTYFYFRDPYIEDSLTEEEYRKIFPSTHVQLMKMCDDMWRLERPFFWYILFKFFSDPFKTGPTIEIVVTPRERICIWAILAEKVAAAAS